ncbi:uncharacterized protein MELLADRAFT_93974 [Melampsora larici-populina 98AG31]|uniref:Alpha-type protein kinase domain-containing protein n=1 Tax=Melampsora larici-populina (strain 98AG31 / pathotype 3-4-7) TaxID=747676 RepID=F4S413_MELLP|nr:uncharacterized protein MELLADRAFT_93130 [Melampsora larici-populina 98AG31]XP_007416773.1 uncharacterized protein MELLADRAFT_93974 [Melampsora larici-populina 98AG31]EGF99984.1 hypothetical protein MELLADRAFT_93974 [Melampsora larici-populina 98AG31]EGG00625.1 hypothetical protein MELLADRAFT_93130 [Melampsora larici-populina 98AG31]
MTSLIGVGRNMKCFKAKLLIDNQVYSVVAKHHISKRCPLEQYQRQAQSYVHAEAAIESFKADVLYYPKFTALDKELAKKLRIAKCWVVQKVGTKAQVDDATDSDFWLFEEELDGKFVKYMGNDNFINKHSCTPIYQMIHALAHHDLQENGGRSFVCDLQGGGATLTDPAVNDLDKTFGSGNLNYEGLRLMIDQHRENQWCRNFGLDNMEKFKRQLEL